MFFQGILATPIPYMIFAVLYLIGIMPNAYDTLKDKFGEEVASEIVTEAETVSAELAIDFIWIEKELRNQNTSISYWDAFLFAFNTDLQKTKFLQVDFVLHDKLKSDQVNSRPPPHIV